jgi:hypothetical protein
MSLAFEDDRNGKKVERPSHGNKVERPSQNHAQTILPSIMKLISLQFPTLLKDNKTSE